MAFFFAGAALQALVEDLVGVGLADILAGGIRRRFVAFVYEAFFQSSLPFRPACVLALTVLSALGVDLVGVGFTQLFTGGIRRRFVALVFKAFFQGGLPFHMAFFLAGAALQALVEDLVGVGLADILTGGVGWLLTPLGDTLLLNLGGAGLAVLTVRLEALLEERLGFGLAFG
jgi:hypothetical protein